MKRRVTWIIVAIITFIIGVASATGWFYFPRPRNSSQQNYAIPAERESLRGSERMHACLKRFDINLGDSFQYVDGLINLTPDPNGPNENIGWQQGKLTDFFRVPEQIIEIDKENKLQPAIYFTFDEWKRLKSFYISWSLNGEERNSLKRKIIDAVIKGELTCIASEDIDFKKNSFKLKSDFGDYIQEFKYDFSGRTAFWLVSYSIEMK